MRVLAIPYLDQMVLRKSSCWNGMLSTIYACLQKQEDLYVGLVVPKKGSGGIQWEYSEEELRAGHSRLEVIPIPAFEDEQTKAPKFLTETIACSMSMFRYLHPLRKKNYWDVVWNAQNWAGLSIMRYMEHGWLASTAPVPMINLIPDVATNDKVGHFVMVKDGLWQVGDALSAAWSYGHVIQPWEKKALVRDARKVFASAFIKRLEERCRMIPFPMELRGLASRQEEFDVIRTKRREDGHLRVYWGAHFGSRKGAKEWISTVKKAKSIAPIKAVVSSAATALPEEFNEIVEKENVHLGRGLDAYRENLHEADVMLCTAKIITAMVPFEATVSGMVPVFLKEDWLYGMFPPDYPFVVDEKDLPQTLVFIHRNFDKAKEKARQYAEWLIEKYGTDSIAPQMLQFWADVMKDDAANPAFTRGSFAELAKGAVEDGAKTMQEVYDVMQKKSAYGVDFSARGDLISDRIVRKLVLNAGVRDVCDGPEPRFVPIA